MSTTPNTNSRLVLVKEGTWVGNTTRDPELRYIGDDKVVCNAGMAVNQRQKNPSTGEWEDGEPLYLNLSIWDRAGAENFADSIPKGTRIIVTGRLEQRSYTTAEGEARTTFDVSVEEWGASGRWAEITVTRTPKGGSSGGQTSPPPAPAAGGFDEPF